MYQARFAAHSRSNSDLNRIPFGSGSTGGGGCDGGTRRSPPGGFMDVDATFQDSPSAAHRKIEADQDRGNQESSRAARGQEGLAEGVAERLAEEFGAGGHRPNEHGCSRSRGHEIDRSAVGTLTPSTRTGSESNELHSKIEEIDAKIERLQAKRAKYASRLDRLQGKMEKLAGPIQWSAYQNLTRIQQGGDRTPEK